MVQTRLRDAALLLGTGAVALGLSRAPIAWALLAPRGLDTLAVASLAIVTGGLLLAAGRRLGAAAGLGVVAVFALVFSGLPSVAATALLLLGAVAAGSLLPRAAGIDPLVTVVAGLGLVAAVGGWLLPFPVHRGPAWALALGALVLVRRHAVLEELRLLGRLQVERMRAAPWAALAWSAVLAVATLPAWLPITNVDDLVYHINLGNEFLRYGHGRFDVGAQSFALAPWSADLLHAVVTVVAGREGTGPLNAFWLVACALLVQSLGQALGLSAGRAWLASMLYASLPLSAFLAGSLQTEAPTAAILVAIALAIHGGADARAQRLPVIAVLAGFALAIKLSNALLLAPFALWLAVSWVRDVPWRAFGVSVMLGLVTAGASYAYAAALTGNPVLPMLNGVFRSPWFAPENFVDPTWQTGFGPGAFWGLVFDTSRYYEGGAGAAGLALIALAGGIPLALLRPAMRPPLLAALVSLLLVFHQVQYLRYLHPCLAVLLPALAAALLPENGRWSWREAVLGLLVALQLFLLPTTSWKFGDGVLRQLFTGTPREITDRFVPERELHEDLRDSLLPTDRILYADPARSHVAELPGQAVGVAWFAPLVSRILASPGSPAEVWARVEHRTGVNHVMVHNLPEQRAVAAFLDARGAVRVASNGPAAVYWLPPRLLPPESIVRLSDHEVSLDVPLDRAYPALGQVAVALGCSQPGKPVAIGWSIVGTPTGAWEWVSCGPDGVAITAVQFTAGPRTGVLNLVAKPAQPDDRMTLRGLVAAADVRRDFAGETALYRWVVRPFCRSESCGDAAGDSLTSVAEGNIVEYVQRLAEGKAAVAPASPPPAGPGGQAPGEVASIAPAVPAR